MGGDPVTIEALREEVQNLRVDVRNNMGELRTDIKELTKAFRELVRIDGDVNRLRDAVGRIGKEVEDHEKRLRAIEAVAPETRTKLHFGERLLWAAVSVGVGVLVYVITH